LVEHYFYAFNLSYISRETNKVVDSLVVVASNFRVPLKPKDSYEINIKHRPSIPENIKHWQVFEDDQQLQKFLECIDEFSESQIDEDEESSENDDKSSYKNMIVGQEIIDLKTNHIPRDLVPLERFFDNNDIYLRSNGKVEAENTVDCNIGTSLDPKNVKITKSLPAEIRTKYQELISQFSDVFALSYNDLKTYDKKVMQHKIPLKPDTEPVRQKIRHLDPMLLPIIEKEIKKLWEANIILPLRFSNWVANIVPLHQKNGEIRICMDFRNLNRCSLKDNYPLPKMDHILQRVVGSKCLSMIDGFSAIIRSLSIRETKRR
jgi:hypothetical protein